jgi:hypothetical protein
LASTTYACVIRRSRNAGAPGRKGGYGSVRASRRSSYLRLSRDVRASRARVVLRTWQLIACAVVVVCGVLVVYALGSSSPKGREA